MAIHQTTGVYDSRAYLVTNGLNNDNQKKSVKRSFKTTPVSVCVCVYERVFMRTLHQGNRYLYNQMNRV